MLPIFHVRYKRIQKIRSLIRLVPDLLNAFDLHIYKATCLGLQIIENLNKKRVVG